MSILPGHRINATSPPPCAQAWLVKRLCLAARAEIPVENRLACPERDAGMAACIVEKRFKILDPMRRTRDIGMDRKAKDLGTRGAFAIKPVELVARPLEENLRAVMLDHHHWDVV